MHERRCLCALSRHEELHSHDVGLTAALCCRFLVGSDSSDDEDDKRVVRSAKDRRGEELRTICDEMRVGAGQRDSRDLCLQQLAAEAADRHSILQAAYMRLQSVKPIWSVRCGCGVVTEPASLQFQARTAKAPVTRVMRCAAAEQDAHQRLVRHPDAV